MTALAIIPARGGSKGLPRKNLRRLADRPLLAWTIEAALRATRVERVVVSSEDPEILEVARDWGAEPLIRPIALAADDTPSEPVVRHAVECVSKRGWTPGTTVLLQPTSPLRTAEDVDAALARIEDRGAEAVISVFEPPHSPYKCFVRGVNGYLRGLVSDEAPFQRRQDQPRALMPNGAIYAIRTELFLETGRLLTPRTLPFEMPAERSLDIDRSEDLALAERWLRRTKPTRRNFPPTPNAA